MKKVWFIIDNKEYLILIIKSVYKKLWKTSFIIYFTCKKQPKKYISKKSITGRVKKSIKLVFHSLMTRTLGEQMSQIKGIIENLRK